jgi:FSR family fosmidomycin resistance protein-like MFS transporter
LQTKKKREERHEQATKSLVATALAHFVNDGTLYIFPMLYPILIKSYGLSQPLVGSLASLTSLFAIAAAPFVGRRSDRSQNYGYMMTLGIVLMAFGILGYAFSVIYLRGFDLFLTLLPSTLLVGVGSSFYHPLAASILDSKWDASSRGRAMGINGSMGSLGVTLYPIITVALVVALTIPSIAILALVSFASAVIVLKLMSNTSSVPSSENSISILHGEEEEEEKEGTDDRENATTTKEKGEVEIRRKRRRDSISFKILLPTIAALTVVSFVRGLVQGVIVFLPTYLQIDRHVDYAYLGLAIAIMPAMGILSQPSFGYVSDRLGRRLALAISGIGLAASFLLFLSVQNVVLGEIFLALFGLFNFTSFPLVLGLATEISPEGAKTIASSIVWGVGTTGGGALGPILVAILALPSALGSLGASFYALTLLTLISVAILPFVPRPARRKN